MRTSIVEIQRKELSKIADKLQFVVFPDEFDVLYYSNFFSFDDHNIRWDKFPEIKEKIIEGFGRNVSLHYPKSEQILIQYIFDFVDPEFAFVLFNAHVKYKMNDNPILKTTFNLFPKNYEFEFDFILNQFSRVRTKRKFIQLIISLSTIFQHPLILKNKERIIKLESILRKRKTLITPDTAKIIRDMLKTNIPLNPLFKTFFNYVFELKETPYLNMLNNGLKSKKVLDFFKLRLKLYSILLTETHATTLKDILDVIMSYNYFDDLSKFDDEIILLQTNLKKSNHKRHLRRLFLLNYNKISNEKFRDVLIEPTKYEQYLIAKYKHYFF